MTKTDKIKNLFRAFENIVCDYARIECWSARKRQKLL
jgi:hypothetical protein